MSVSIPRLFHTVRHLRPIQIANRLQRKLLRPRFAAQLAPSIRPLAGPWTDVPKRPQSLIQPDRLRVFEREYRLHSAADWNAPQAHLVVYNLHYFDDLTAARANERRTWQRELICRWIDENPPGQGAGWDPYPLSLRIVNWIKSHWEGRPLDSGALNSLATQAAALPSMLEYHLLGNHLLANAKALVFAGCFFEGPIAERWLEQGLSIYRGELPEQVLSDGGHFELSPMYHGLILEDLLDLWNLGSAFKDLHLAARLPQLSDTIDRMRRWLTIMSHPDGEIAFFNDAAMGIAISPPELNAYARRLGQPPIAAPSLGITHLEDSGYIRLQNDTSVLLLDVAEVGPAYQPGHAHADTLSFEWSLGSARVMVNSGTSCYGITDERARQRSTAAHNTVEVDGQNSSEVWSGFRVARRAHPRDLQLEASDDKLRVQCAHDGYRRLPGKVMHRRRWELGPNQLRIEDRLDGDYRQAIGRFHFHPSVELRPDEAICDYGPLRFVIQNGSPRCSRTTFHPGFDLSIENPCLESTFSSAVHELLWQW